VTIHYHMGPVTPAAALERLAGRHLGVSFAYPSQVERIHEIAQSVMLDNGAFTAFKKGRAVADWAPYYAWSDQWLDHPATWAVIPDEIDAGSQQQDALLREWPHGQRGVPVWHTGEPIERLLRLCEEWPLVCVGSTDAHWQVGGLIWTARMHETFEAVERTFKRTPRLHMLRGMSQCGGPWPFYSVDSSSVAQNHWRRRAPLFSGVGGHEFGSGGYAQKFDVVQCPPRWLPPLIEEAA
jgi:2-oxoglutarate dehydrogenase complex dehydrogenase (E1) component-like enzyme